MSEQTAEAVAAAQIAEYGRYVATEKIYVGTALGWNVGDPVPVGHVEGYDRPEVVDGAPTGKTEHIAPVVRSEQVKKVTTKKAAAPASTKES